MLVSKTKLMAVCFRISDTKDKCPIPSNSIHILTCTQNKNKIKIFNI